MPRSLADPVATNIDGFLNMLLAARDAKMVSFTYGDHPTVPKVKDAIGWSLCPYAVTKYVDELYADVFARWAAAVDAHTRHTGHAGVGKPLFNFNHETDSQQVVIR